MLRPSFRNVESESSLLPARTAGNGRLITEATSGRRDRGRHRRRRSATSSQIVARFLIYFRVYLSGGRLRRSADLSRVGENEQGRNNARRQVTSGKEGVAAYKMKTARGDGNSVECCANSSCNAEENSETQSIYQRRVRERD